MLTIDVDHDQINKDLKQINNRIRFRMIRAVKQAMRFASNFQAGVYTADSNPVQPSGSTYERTFYLREGVTEEMVSQRLPLIEGLWYIRGVPYDRWVIGDEQAIIHEDRWLDENGLEVLMIQNLNDNIIRELGDLF